MNLQHEYVECTMPECVGKEPHCGYVWCGAPKQHSLHTLPTIDYPRAESALMETLDGPIEEGGR